jgi:hypothetical protein
MAWFLFLEPLWNILCSMALELLWLGTLTVARCTIATPGLAVPGSAFVWDL